MPELAESHLLERMHANYRECWRYFARTVPGGAIVETPGVTCIATTIPIAFFNTCFITRDADPKAAVALAQQFYAERKVPWMVCTYGQIAAVAGKEAGAAGLTASEPSPGMLLAPLAGVVPQTPGLEVRTVCSLAELHDFNVTAARGFGLPEEMMTAWDTESMLAGPDATFYLGYVEAQPVATSMRFASHRIAGVYTVSTLPEYRGRGIGEAMTWQAALGGQAEGCIASALQASKMGFPVYRRMGYRHIVDYETWETPT